MYHNNCFQLHIYTYFLVLSFVFSYALITVCILQLLTISNFLLTAWCQFVLTAHTYIQFKCCTIIYTQQGSTNLFLLPDKNVFT